MNRSLWVKLGGLCLFVLGLSLGFKVLGIDLTTVSPERVRGFVLSFGGFAPLVYLLAYGQPIVPLPASVMTMTGGLAFGPFWGTVAALTGATVRACGQFLIARLFGREAVEKLLKGKLARLDQQVGQHSFKAVLFVRLIPNFPFDMQNYGLGFSKVRFGAYAFGTFLGMIPGSFAYVYLGYSLTDPRHFWKLGVAILIVVGLIVAQRAWQSRHPRAPSAGRA